MEWGDVADADDMFMIEKAVPVDTDDIFKLEKVDTVDMNDTLVMEASDCYLVRLRMHPQNVRMFNCRKALGWTQRDLASRLGVSVGRISRIEVLGIVDRGLMGRIAYILDEKMDYLFPGSLLKAIEAGVFDARAKDLSEPVILTFTEIAEKKIGALTSGEELSEGVDKQLLHERLMKAIDIAVGSIREPFDEQAKRVLELRFGLVDGHSRTLEEVGKEFGLGRERVRQIEARVLRLLRHLSSSRMLKEFLV